MQNGADDYLSKPIDLLNLEVHLLAAGRIISLQRTLIQQKVALQLLNQELFNQARRDPLTDTGNRLQLQEDLDRMCACAERYGHAYSVALCDIDLFKAYNDCYGHLAGDEVIRTVARTLTAHCRTGDTVYRYGGEEFLLIFPEQTPAQAQMALERMRCAVLDLKIPHDARPQPRFVTVSVGVSELRSREHKTVYSLLKEADIALYRAKDAGRNALVAYTCGDLA